MLSNQADRVWLWPITGRLVTILVHSLEMLVRIVTVCVLTCRRLATFLSASPAQNICCL